MITLSAVLLFGAAAAFLLRSRALGFGSGLVAFLFGFFTAATGAAGPIRDVVTSLARALGSIAT